MNVWAHGWSRMPNAIAEALEGCAVKAHVMGVYLWIVNKASKMDMTGACGLRRGQVKVSWEAGAKELGLSVMQLRRAVETLKETGVVTSEKVREGRKFVCIVSICNYDRYNGQNTTQQADTKEPLRQPCDSPADSTNDRRFNLNKEFKKKETKNEEEKEERFVTVANLSDYLIAQREWADWFCQSYGMDHDTLRLHLDAFAFQLQSRGEMRKSADDALKHFSNWFQMRQSRATAQAQVAEAQRQAALQQEEEEKKRRRDEAQRKAREANSQKQKFLREIFAKADAGDAQAIEIINKHGLVRYEEHE